MPKTPKPTELVCVIDRSGSMQSTLQDAQDGFNTFIELQKEQGGDCNVTLYQFDDSFDTVWARQPLKKAGKYKLEPRGGTALLDAVGRAVASTKPDKGSNVIVLIVTDGGENQSVEYKLPQVRELIEEKQAKGWSFAFVGAGLDAFSEASNMGIRAGSSLRSSNTGAGFATSYGAVTSSVSRSRMTGDVLSYTDEERDSVE